MKVFLQGSQSLFDLPSDVEKRLIELNDALYEFLLIEKPGAASLMNNFLNGLANCTKTVWPYTEEKRWLDYSEQRYPSYEPIIAFDLPERSDALREADHFLFAWDGEDELTFFDMIRAIKNDKFGLEAWSPFSKGVILIKEYRDILKLLPPEKNGRVPYRNNLPIDLYENLISEFGEPKEEFIPTTLRYEGNEKLIEMILTSPASLDRKHKAFKRLGESQDFFRDVLEDISDFENRKRKGWDLPEDNFCLINVRSYKAYARDFREAEDALDLAKGEVFLLRKHLEPENEQLDESMCDIFTSFTAVEDTIRKKLDKENPSWYQLEKWVPWKVGKMGRAYIFTLIENKPAYFTKRYPMQKEWIYGDNWAPVAIDYDYFSHIQWEPNDRTSPNS